MLLLQLPKQLLLLCLKLVIRSGDQSCSTAPFRDPECVVTDVILLSLIVINTKQLYGAAQAATLLSRRPEVRSDARRR